MRSPLVYIIIINWNGLEDTCRCLESLLQINYDNYRIILIDNCSTKPEGVKLSTTFGPQIELIQNDQNLGFSGGCNQGIRRAIDHDAKYVLLLNNDTIVERDFLRILVASAENNPAVGIVGPKLLNRDGSIQVESARRFPSLWDQFFGYSYLTSFGRIFLGGKVFGRFLMYDFNKNTSRPVDMVCGACMLISASVIQKIGLFDPDYFLFGEDMDYCFRTRKAGYEILYVPKAEIVHLQGQSMKQLRTKHYVNLALNDFTFYKKNYNLTTAKRYRVIVQSLFWVHLLVDSIYSVLRGVNVGETIHTFRLVFYYIHRWQPAPTRLTE